MGTDTIVHSVPESYTQGKTMIRRYLIACCVVFTTTVSSASAQFLGDDDYVWRSGWTGAIGLSYLSFDSEALEEEGLGDAGWSVDLKGSYQFARSLLFEFGLGFVQFDDNEEFVQGVLVTDVFGTDAETRNSDASAISVFGEFNYQIPSSSAVRLRFGAGYSGIANAERDIKNCSNCRSDDLSVEGGPYLTATALFSPADRIGFGVSVRQYVAGDVSNGVHFWLEYLSN